MKCKKCGNEIKSKDKICSKCGAEVEKKDNAKRNRIITIGVMAVLMVAIVITVVLTVNKNKDNNDDGEEHVTKREQCITTAITTLEDYRDDKITGEEAATKLREIANTAQEESKKEEKDGTKTYKSLKWSNLYLDAEFMATNIETVNLIKIEKYNKLDENKINEYIDTLKKELEE